MSTLRTPHDLQVESKTLWYEFSQLCEIANRLRSGQVMEDLPVHNALVESFAIHCRAIGCFFFAHDRDFPDPRSGDLVAEHFVPGWATCCPAPSETIIRAKQACDKQVAHITGMRRDLNFVPGHEHSWRVADVELELRGILNRFLECARPEQFDPTALAGLLELRLVRKERSPSAQSPPVNMTAKTCPPSDDPLIDRKSITGGVTE